MTVWININDYALAFAQAAINLRLGWKRRYLPLPHGVLLDSHCLCQPHTHTHTLPVSWHWEPPHNPDWMAGSWQALGSWTQHKCWTITINLTATTSERHLYYVCVCVYPVIFWDLRFWYSISSTVHTAPFTFSTRTKHLCRLRLCRTAFC